MQFSDVIGHQEQLPYLIRSVDENRVSHAQLFLGPEGAGKLVVALAYAQYLNCENRQNSDSCGICPSCYKAAKLIHPDIHFSFPFITKKSENREKCSDYLPQWRKALLENPFMSLHDWYKAIDAENKQGNITVNECHDIQRKLNFKSFESPYKILIMWRPEFLGNAGNVLLKMIEEPPANTVFILVAEDLDLILTTIVSRMQFVKLTRPGDEEIGKALQQRYGLSPEQALSICRISEGNVSEAFKHAANDVNANAVILRDWLSWCINYDFEGITGWVENFASLGRENQKSFLVYALQFMDEYIRYILGVGDLIRLTAHEAEIAGKLSPVLDFNRAEKVVGYLNEAFYHIERNAHPRILMLYLSIRITKCIITERKPVYGY